MCRSDDFPPYENMTREREIPGRKTNTQDPHVLRGNVTPDMVVRQHHRRDPVGGRNDTCSRCFSGHLPHVGE